MDAAGTIGGVLLSKAASLVGARWGERRKAREATRSRLRSVVTYLLAQLDSTDAYHVLAQRRVELDAAVGELQAMLIGRALSRLNAALKRYRECRDAVQPALLVFLQSEATGQPIDPAPRARLVEALRALLVALK